MPYRRFTVSHAALVVWTIGWANFTAKYHRSILGYLWSFALPVVKLIVLFFVFKPLVGQSIQSYVLYLFMGLIVWEHFSLITSKCIGVLQEKSALVQRVNFPRILLMLIVGCTSLFVAITYFLIFLLCALYLRLPLWPIFLYVPVALLQMTLVGLGIGMFLASFSLRFPDLEHLWGVVLQILFWLTPVIYPHTFTAPLLTELTRLAQGGPTITMAIQGFIRVQPLSILIHDARRALLYVADAGFPSFVHILGVTSIAAIVFLLGAFVFVRRSKYFLQEY